jgi:hypothetical protein
LLGGWGGGGFWGLGGGEGGGVGGADGGDGGAVAVECCCVGFDCGELVYHVF